MKRFLFDSNALNNYIYRRSGVFEKAIAARRLGARIGTGLPVVAEILAGAEFSDSRERNLPIVVRNLRYVRLWPFDLKAAHKYAQLYADLRRRGRTIQSIDLMIAAIASTLPKCTIFSADRDFLSVPGIRIENWAS